MKLFKYVKLAKEIKTKDTKEVRTIRPSYYFIKLDNGQIIPIKPIFSRDYSKLDVLCDTVIFEKPKDSNVEKDNLPF